MKTEENSIYAMMGCPQRYCPECENQALEVTEDDNTYECNACGSIWRRLKPLNDGTGKMINKPTKLKKMLNIK